MNSKTKPLRFFISLKSISPPGKHSDMFFPQVVKNFDKLYCFFMIFRETRKPHPNQKKQKSNAQDVQNVFICSSVSSSWPPIPPDVVGPTLQKVHEIELPGWMEWFDQPREGEGLVFGWEGKIQCYLKKKNTDVFCFLGDLIFEVWTLLMDKIYKQSIAVFMKSNKALVAESSWLLKTSQQPDFCLTAKIELNGRFFSLRTFPSAQSEMELIPNNVHEWILLKNWWALENIYIYPASNMASIWGSILNSFIDFHGE